MDKARFDELREQWHRDTQLTSSAEIINQHASVKEFITAGISILPFIIEDMKRPDCYLFWYFPLCQITDCDPIPEHHAGLIAQMNNDWIVWYEQIYLKEGF